jgi:cytochrome P450
LIELARNPEKQTKLREELLEFGVGDPTWDQLVSGLPYLDAVVQEILRLHPPLADSSREVIIAIRPGPLLPLSNSRNRPW